MTHCKECGCSLTGRAGKNFCSEKCRSRWRRKNPAADDHAEAHPTLQCPNCNADFVQTRRTKKFCSNKCAVRFGQKKLRRAATVQTTPVPAAEVRHASHLPAPAAATKAASETARLFGDGFFMGHLLEEIERIGKLPGIVAKLEAQLLEALMDDAVWPIGRPGRIALTLALLKNPALRTGRWRHPHEQRLRAGVPRRPTGIAIRAGRVRS